MIYCIESLGKSAKISSKKQFEAQKTNIEDQKNKSTEQEETK